MPKTVIKLWAAFRPDDVCAACSHDRGVVESCVIASSPLNYRLGGDVGDVQRKKILTKMKRDGWRIIQGTFTAHKSRKPKCHCCGIRAQDPHDPEKRCGHKDCIPF